MKRFLPILFSVFILSFSLLAGKVYAETTQVPSTQVDCKNTSDQEFHSLRPYQKSPCNANMSDTANFCGDSLTFTDNIEEPFYSSQDPGCHSTSPGNVTCDYVINGRNESINIDLSGAQLPIMGRTEGDVINSQNSDETLSDAGKVNGYVSWYLNGTVNRAEYSPLNAIDDCIGETSQKAGRCSDVKLGMCVAHSLIPIVNPITVTPDGASSCSGGQKCCVPKFSGEKVDILDRDRLINYSGPLNKLLPQEVGQQQRAQTVKDAVASKDNGAGIRHDQIVGCTYGIDLPNIKQLLNALGIDLNLPFLDQAFAIPGPCYIPGVWGVVTEAFEKSRRLSDFEYSPPPVRSDPKYKDYIDYEHALEVWRGKGCVELKIPDKIPIVNIPIPIIGGKGIIYCFDNPLNPNYIAQLYPNIPLSSTEDRVGQAQGSAAPGSIPAGVTISNFVATSTAANLYFSHMEETATLAGLLQKIYLPEGADPAAPGNSVPVQIGSSCKIVDVRSGAGDSLFAGSIGINISYDAAFSCDFVVPYCSEQNNNDCTYGCRETMDGGECCPDPNTYPYPFCDPPDPTPTQSCTKSIPIAVNITTHTPLVDDIWTRLVSGSASIFRRIFPKLGAGSGIGEVKDIPASSNVTYTGTNNGVAIPESTGQLNFPHIGGISEYFLKGIQTALRPKGFGEPISFGDSGSVPEGKCDGSVFQKLGPPAQTTTQASDYFSSYIQPNLTSTVVSVYKEAEKQTGVPCEVLAGIHFIEGSNNPNASLQNGGPLTGTLLESAVQAGNELKAKVGGSLDSWDSVITALSRYNGGGNSNCGKDSRYTGACPPPEGIDDPYPTSWIDSGHLNMYLIYCSDYTKCTEPFPFFDRPGALTVATEFFNTEEK